MYGARPLKRLIRSEVENRLAKAILDGAVADGDTVTVSTTAPVDDPTSELTLA